MDLLYYMNMEIHKNRIIVYALWMYLFLTPLSFIGFIPGISFTRMIVFLPLFVSIFYINRMKLIFDRLIILPITYIFILLLSVFFSIDQSVSAERVFSVAQNIGVILLFSSIQFNKNELKVIKHGIVASGWFTFGLLLLFAEPLGDTFRISINIGGISQDPNDLVGYIMFSLVFYFSEVFLKRSFKAILLLFPFITILLLTGSRGGMISVLFAMVMFIIINSNFSVKYFVNVALVLIFMFIIFDISKSLLPVELITRYSFEFTEFDGGAGRFAIWDSLLNYWKDSSLFRKLFGWGTGTVQNYSYGKTVAHNVWIEALLEIGVVGLLALVVFYFSFFYKAYKEKQFVIFATLCGIIIMTLSLSLYSYKPLWNLFFLIIVIARSEKN